MSKFKGNVAVLPATMFAVRYADDKKLRALFVSMGSALAWAERNPDQAQVNEVVTVMTSPGSVVEEP